MTTEESVRVDVRPPFWQRLLEVFRRGSPRPLRIGFMLAPVGPGGQCELQHVQVSVMAPCGIREIDLSFEVTVSAGHSVHVDPA